MLIVSDFGTIFNGNYSFIYIWVSKEFKFVYVGQTNDAFGSFGRAYSHISNEGTLRKNFEERFGFELEEVLDLKLLSFPLPQIFEFTGLERSYREAVEITVQKELIAVRGELMPPFKIISNVRPSPRESSLSVKSSAQEIIAMFLKEYKRL